MIETRKTDRYYSYQPISNRVHKKFKMVSKIYATLIQHYATFSLEGSNVSLFFTYYSSAEPTWPNLLSRENELNPFFTKHFYNKKSIGTI